MCEAKYAAILDSFRPICATFAGKSRDMIPFFVPAFRYFRDFSNFSSGQRTR
jgi:hypothetical protein